ncbi:MAG TPA: FIST N-terminal domain-containing protein [Vicinamibacterales bacterium]|nr:FIST N-terminal domain-containing protein [Vicinamibacterales bacterium]
MSTLTAAVYTASERSDAAGMDLGTQLREALGGVSPDAAILFASSRFDYAALLAAFNDTCHPAVLVGASSAGEFVRGQRGEGSACAIAITSDQMKFAAAVGRNVTADRAAAAQEVVRSFAGLGNDSHPHRTALVMTDALAGHADELIEHLTLATSGRYQFAGGGAGDDAKFSKTHVFCGTAAYTNAVVALEILSTKPVGIGVGHGWTPASDGLRVTAVEGSKVISLNGLPAADAFQEHAESTGQLFDRSQPLPFFLHNILGIETGDGHRLRVPLAVDDSGAVICAAEVPLGATVHVMKTTSQSAIAAAQNATQSALAGLRGEKPSAALFFDCVATRLRMGDDFGFEVDSVGAALGEATLVGCNTYGQIARAEGQFGGFHNCTAVVLVLPS